MLCSTKAATTLISAFFTTPAIVLTLKIVGVPINLQKDINYIVFI